MSESKNMSSPYVVLENRSLDQWKVTELKEELKKRKLMTKGLKDDLVKRLDEAIRAELDQTHDDNGVNDVYQPEPPSELDENSAKNESLEEDNMAENFDKNESLEKDNMPESLDDENRDNKNVIVEMDNVHGTEGFQVLQEISVETSVTATEVSSLQREDEESKEEAKPNPSDFSSQVVEVSQVKSDSISIHTTTTTTTSMSITDKNEDNVIADDVKLELDVKRETESVVVGEPLEEDKVTTEEKDVNIDDIINISKKNDGGDLGSPEKLNFDRSSCDDSMEEDALESKQIDSISEKPEVPLVKEDVAVDVMVEDTPAAKHTESTKDKGDPAVAPTKRKLHGQEEVTNSEVVKRQHMWNSEQQTTNSSVSTTTTPKGAFQASTKNRFSRSKSSVSHEEPKECVVPPSSKPQTTSLRIDRFLRPFTLKAVQELLGKTGTVVSFWMDHIKTHCYVTFSSVEEAVETRNAVYNLQWPTNGGRLLIAEFVDPSDVKSRTEAPLSSPPTPVSVTTPNLPRPPPAATQPPQKQQQLPPPPPLPLPPPPPLSLPPQSREPALPPPPPLPEKIEPPIVTLDDLFRKTRATPRIYYLPLSEEQVAAKLKGQGRNA